MGRGCWAMLVACCLLLGLNAQAEDWYVAADGLPENEGQPDSPWDLVSVARGDQPAVAPGDTVWLLGGAYGSQKGEDQLHRREFRFTLSGQAPDGERQSKPIIFRAYPGDRVTMDKCLFVDGHDLWFWGLEVVTSAPLPEKPTEEIERREGGIFARDGARCRFINCVVHGNNQWIVLLPKAVDAEVYGCIIYGNGWPGNVRGHGHGLYTQNTTGTKRILDNVMFNGFGWNFHAYTPTDVLQGYHLEGNVSFSSGMMAKGDPLKDNYMFLSETNSLDRITMVNNVAYDPRSEVGWRPNVRYRSYKAKNFSGVCQGNYFMGGNGLFISNWKEMVISGNTIWSPGLVVRFESEPDARWKVTGNTYICPANRAAFSDKLDSIRTFRDYQAATGFDKDSTLIDAAKPAKNYVFLRPNKYEPGRAHVAVFNWEGRAALPLDLNGVLHRGAKFEIYNVQDLYGRPVAKGTFTGGAVIVPMLKSEIAPEFDAFLVVTVEEH